MPTQYASRPLQTLILFLGIMVLLTSLTASAQSASNYREARKAIKTDGYTYHSRIIDKPNSKSEYILLLPSLGRGVEDFTAQYGSNLSEKLADSGYRVLLIQPRESFSDNGIPTTNITMQRLALDIKNLLDELKIKHVHLVGHAFGNRLARTFTTIYPQRVSSLSLVAAGGNFSMNDQQKHCLKDSLNLSMADNIRLKAISCAFFASGQNPRIWLNGWYPELAQIQVHAATSIDPDFYKSAGGKPFLIIQGSEDYIAPPEQAGITLKRELGNQVTYVEISNAGHAMLPEQPMAVAQALIEYIQAFRQ